MPASQLLTCAEALATVRSCLADLPVPQVETVDLGEALGRVLAQPVLADRDQPPFPRSTRDGFAVRSADLVTGGPLRNVGTVRAGQRWTGDRLQPGEAIEIMTGAPVPAGADAVLMLEHVGRHGDTLQSERTSAPGENIVPTGAEAQAGQVLLQSGVRLGPAEIALAASVGAASVPVFQKPVVAILSTGDELVPVDRTPGPQQIRNSNAHALAALVRQSGGTPQLLPVAEDTSESLAKALDHASGASMLILSGGVSAGKYDLVEPVLLSRGATFLFTGVRMQPGKPVVFGRTAQGERTQWIFGLPGNPVSTQVTAMLFAMPMLRAMGGEVDPQPLFGAAILSETVRVQPGLTRFLPARFTATLGQITIRPTGWQGSGDLHSNARANCYLVVPPDAAQLVEGAVVQTLLR